MQFDVTIHLSFDTIREEIMNFSVFKRAVARRFEEMKKFQLYRTDVDKDQLWSTYLSSFPAGTDPMFRERTEHDCSCCKSFIRSVGNVIAVNDKMEMMSIWDINIIDDEPAYQAVADCLATLVKANPISNEFKHFENRAGADKTFENLMGNVKAWEHFFINIPSTYVMKNADIASYLGEATALHDVLLRSLRELSDDAVETVQELIAQNSLYRGADHKFAVDEFAKLKAKFNEMSAAEGDLFAWVMSKKVPASVSKIRNTSIGTLLVDLTDGVDLEDAVKKFEAMVAPANYKRPTALVTKKMIDDARKKITELGLTSALERRYAVLNDITVNNILFVDRSARKALSGDIFDDLPVKATSKQKLDRVEEVTIENFIANILPKAESLEIFVENRHTPNFVSLIAPVDPTANQLFKWSNPFSWSYNGEMADSIKERVKQAGGRIEGFWCNRLAWEYEDDLDFHMYEPGDHIYFSNRRRTSRNGGVLDVDANGCDGVRKDPCENIVYERNTRMQSGEYKLVVHNYNRRSSGVGFVVEVEFDGNVYRFEYDKVLRSGEHVEVATFKYGKDGLKIVTSMPSTSMSRNNWGLSTQQFQKVNVMMLSPNFWDGQVGIGNKHYFFMLDGCANEGTARGFFNEFLTESLNKHRKVLEMVGTKMKTAEAAEQLSGLGFSVTKRDEVLCRVSGSFNRTIKIVF